jgi:predicted nucleotidyltransferase
LQIALEQLTGVRVDVQTPGALPPGLRDKILSEAKPV